MTAVVPQSSNQATNGTANLVHTWTWRMIEFWDLSERKKGDSGVALYLLLSSYSMRGRVVELDGGVR